jgi:hypothetical protein
MLPLPFPRYVELFNIHLPRGDLGFVLSNYQAYNQFIPILNDLLERYEVTGGFPNAIRDFLRTGGISSDVLSDFISSIVSDVNRLRRSETFLKLTVRGIMERTASEFSYIRYPGHLRWVRLRLR